MHNRDGNRLSKIGFLPRDNLYGPGYDRYQKCRHRSIYHR